MERPRKTVARRVLASFGVTLLAFAVTIGWGVALQRRAAEDNEELAKGYVPVALKLAQLRSTQATIASLVDGISGEKDPVSTRRVIETLAGARRVTFSDARAAMLQGLRELGSDETRSFALLLTGELDAIELGLGQDQQALARLLAAVAEGDKDTSDALQASVAQTEHDAEKKIRALSDKFAGAMDRLSEAARERERRSVLVLVALTALALGVGAGTSLHVRRLLGPLARVTERAKAVARGDLTAQTVAPTDDEIGELAVAFEKMVAGVAQAQSRALSNERFAAIGKMAAHVTHEIRNPLSSIGLNIELLEEELAKGGVADESRALLKAITREVERLEHLSEEYLRVARLPQPRMEADDVAALVRELGAFVRPEMERAHCTVRLDVADDLPHTFFDEAQIRQALLNLLRNAREAMADGGAIDLRAFAEGMSVVVTVEDRGSGIPEGIRARVFDPFFSTKGEGTGLGLAITRQIVEAHGGTVKCEAREGGGTVFRVSLPIAPARTALPKSAAFRATAPAQDREPIATPASKQKPA